MNDQSIQEGDLLAYLEGEPLPHVEEALRSSPEIRAEFEALRRTHTVLLSAFGGVQIPNPMDLVDVALDQADSLQQLRVDAYVRDSAHGRRELTELRKVAQQAERPPRRLAIRLPTFFAQPLVSATRSSVRASTESPIEQPFIVAEVDAQVLLQITPASGEQWEIHGQVFQAKQPTKAVQVRLRGAAHRARTRTTDDAGMFVFPRVAVDTYRIEIQLAQGVIVIPEIVVHV